MKEDNSVLGLATIRGNRGISLEQIADATKIGVRLLQAIERGDFRKLPGGIYNISYIRQYARAIDYDADTLLAEYYRETRANAEPPRPVAKGFFSSFRPASPVTGS